MRWPILLAALAVSFDAAAQEPADPIVRVSLEPEIVNVGEAAELRITVLAPTWFPSPPEFPSFEVPNALVRLPPNSSRATSERIGRDTWSGVTRRYEVYPLLGARFRLGGDILRVTVADPGKPAREYELTVPDLELRAVVPPGAAGLDPFIAGTQFEVTREIEGELESLEAGSAIVVSYTAELTGLHAMFIPPLAPAIQQDGVSVYAESPEVQDGTPARRTEKVTLVFDAGGEFTLPASSFEWWNTATGSIETGGLDAVSFNVTGPALADTGQQETTAIERRVWFIGGALLLIAILTARFLVPRLVGAYRQRRATYRASEAFAFRALLAVIRGGESSDVYKTLLGWLKRLDNGLDSRTFAARYGDPELETAIDAISRQRFRNMSSSDNGDADIGPRLSAARRRYLDSRRKRDDSALPDLNP